MTKYNKHLVIVGTARSGTSWLSETIANQHRYRMLFEPEQETRTEKGHLICDKWIQSKDQSKKADHYLKRVFSNRVDCDWIAQNSNRHFKRHLWPIIPKKYIIKFVRANLLAKHINEDFKIPVIHIIRNPYDVIQSQQRVKFPWLTDLSHFVKQPELVELIKTNFKFDIGTYQQLSNVEVLCLRWCIENVIPLEIIEPYKGKSEVIRFEDLFSDIKVFYDLCNTFNIEPVENLEELYRKPSTKVYPESNILNKKNTQNALTKDELKQANGILDVFNSKLYPRL